MRYSPTMPACRAVPQPTMRMSVDFAQFLRCEIQSAELRGAFLEIEAATHGVLDRHRLLVDFLEHVMGKVAQFVLARLVNRSADFQALLLWVAI